MKTKDLDSILAKAVLGGLTVKDIVDLVESKWGSGFVGGVAVARENSERFTHRSIELKKSMLRLGVSLKKKVTIKEGKIQIETKNGPREIVILKKFEIDPAIWDGDADGAVIP